MQKFDVFLRSLGRKKQLGYVLAGAESLLRGEAERAIVKTVLGEDAGAGLVVLDGRREAEPLEAADFLDEARTRTLLGGRKVVSVRRADAVARKSVDAVVAYLEDPEPDSVLVMHFEGWEKRSAVAKKLDRWAVDCGPLYESDYGSSEISASSSLGRWLASRASSRKLALGADAVVRLVELVGTNLAELDAALERLAAAAGGGRGSLGASDVDRSVAPTRAYSVFRVAELAASGRASEALAAAEACFEQGLSDEKGKTSTNEGTVAARLGWAIARELETLYAAHGLLDRGGSVERDFSKIGVPKFRAGQVERAARAFRREELERALELAFDSEFAVKRGELDPRFGLERLVLALGRRRSQLRGR